MKISEIHRQKKQPISFEIFPPKGEMKVESARELMNELAPLRPDYVSVTYSAGGGGNSEATATISSEIKSLHGIESVPHLTCVNSTREAVHADCRRFLELGIENVFALRGDRREGCECTDYHYAYELIAELKQYGFSIGAACYPEGHIEADSCDVDLVHLREKQDIGAEYFLSQLFFDNGYFYRFYDRALSAGITVPIVPGIMPMLSKNQITKMIFSCGASLPAEIVKLLYKYENSADDLRRAGIDYACRQVRELLEKTDCGVHIYTMNRADIAREMLGANV